MITPMKKYSFLVFQPEYEDFLKDVQKLGVLHVIEKENDLGEEIIDKYRLLKHFDGTIKLLQKREIEPGEEKHDKDGLLILDEVDELLDQKDKLLQEKASLLKEAANIEPWGDFNIETIHNLKEQGIFLRFFTCSIRKFDPTWNKKYDIQEIESAKGTLFFVIVSKGEEIDIDAEEWPALTKSYIDLRKEAEKIDNEILKLENELDEYAQYYLPELENSKAVIENSTEFEKVMFHSESEAEEKLMVLEGWVPDPRKVDLDEYLVSKSIVSIVENPSEKDNVPILLKNNRFARLFEPIGRMFMFPIYKELDLVPFFAPFFMLFFGFCLGDAGYGLIFVLGATLFKFKAKKAIKPLISLVQILGFSTVLFGAVSGTFFGANLIDSGYTLNEQSIMELKNEGLPPVVLDSLKVVEDQRFKNRGDFEGTLQKLLVYKNIEGKDTILVDYYSDNRAAIIKSSEPDPIYKSIKSFRHMMLDPNKMFKLAIIFGFIQIIFGMFIKIFNVIRQKGIIYSFPILGWLIGILGAIIIYILVDQGVIIKYKPFAYGLIAVWAILLFGFSNPKNIFISIGAGIGDVYFTSTGILGDLLSYIRLFALGLSSAILGFVFNDLAMQLLSMPPVVGELFFVILLIFGHSINIFLSALGSFVHPMRLTFVEFYKNAGFTGGGKEYKPFEYKLKN